MERHVLQTKNLDRLYFTVLLFYNLYINETDLQMIARNHLKFI